jgi:hypothetical protein
MNWYRKEREGLLANASIAVDSFSPWTNNTSTDSDTKLLSHEDDTRELYAPDQRGQSLCYRPMQRAWKHHS